MIGNDAIFCGCELAQGGLMKTAANLLILATLLGGTAAFGETNSFKQPYVADYDITAPGGKSTMRQMSDGKGHMRTETNSAGQKTTSILDFPGQSCTTILHGQKMIMKSPMRPQDQAAADPSKNEGHVSGNQSHRRTPMPRIRKQTRQVCNRHLD